MNIKIKPICRWFDFWIGFYWDKNDKVLYFFPVPCFGFKIYKETFERALNNLKKLDLPKDKYAIYGSGPLAVRRIRKAQDLDVVVTKDLFEKLKEKHKEKDPGHIVIGNIEFYADCQSAISNPLKVIKRAEEIQGFKFITLKDLIDWKKKLGRDKDLKDIQLIKKYFKESNEQ